MRIRRVLVYLKRIHELLFNKGDSLDFKVVRRGENVMVDNVLKKILNISPSKEVLLWNHHNEKLIMNHIGEYEVRDVGDTCRMVLKFPNFDGEPLRYYAWEGIVPEDDNQNIKLGIRRIPPEYSYGILTGKGIHKMVLVEKYRE